MTALALRPLAAVFAGAALLLAACNPTQAADTGAAVPITPVLGDVPLGSETAKVTILEYASFTCSHCRDFWKQDFPRLKANYIDTGKIKYIYRDFPTDRDLAVLLVGLSRCKGPAKYYELVDDIFSSQVDLFEAAQKGQAGPLIATIAERHGITRDEARTCLADKSIGAALEASIAEGDKRGVRSTPSVFLNDVIQADHTYEALSKAIDAVLGGAPAAPATETPASPTTPVPTAPAAPAPAQ